MAHLRLSSVHAITEISRPEIVAAPEMITPDAPDFAVPEQPGFLDKRPLKLAVQGWALSPG